MTFVMDISKSEKVVFKYLQHLFFNACFVRYTCYVYIVLIDVSLTVKAATLIFISGCGSAISSAKEGESGFIYNLVKS